MSSIDASAPRDSVALSWNAFLSTYLPAFVLALGTGVALPAVPTLAKSFGVTFGLASGVMTAFMVGNLCATIPSGWLIDRFGRRPVLLAGPLLTAAVAFLVAASQTFPELVILRFINGFAAQMWVMARMAAISHSAGPSERGRLISFMWGSDGAGRLAGPVVGGFVAGSWGVHAPFVLYAILALLALVPVVLFARDTTPAARPKATGAPAAPSPSLIELVRPRLVYFGVALLAGLTRGPLGADLLYLYAAFAYHLGPRPIGYMATTAAILTWPIALTAGWVMDRFGRKRTMVPGFGGVGLTMTALAASAFFHLPLEWYMAFFVCTVAFQALAGGSIQTIGADVAPQHGRGMFLGVWSFTGQGGMALSPIVFGLLADHVSYGSAFLFTAAAGAMAAFLLIRYVGETRR